MKLGVYFLGLNLIQSAVGLIISRFKVGTCFPLSFPTCYRNGGGVRPRPAGASAVVEEGSQGWMHATMAKVPVLPQDVKTRLRSRQNRIADILKLVSDPAPFSPHLLIISRLLLKNNTRIPSDPSRIPSDFLTPLPRVLLIFRNSTEVGSRRIPSRIPSILQHLLSQMRILVWRTYSYYNSN